MASLVSAWALIEHRHVDEVVWLGQRYENRGHFGGIPGDLGRHRGGPFDPDGRFLGEALDVGENEGGVVIVGVVTAGLVGDHGHEVDAGFPPGVAVYGRSDASPVPGWSWTGGHRSLS